MTAANASSEQGTPPTDLSASLRDFVALDRLVARWAGEGRLAPDVAAQVRDLIAREWGQEAAAAERTAAPPAAVPPAASRVEPPAAMAPELNLATGQPIPSRAQAPAPVAQSGTPGAPAPVGHAGARPRASRPSLGAALLALGTRRTLLFLGTFLLLMSSLTLVVFNWSSLPAIVQFSILAGTTGAIWAGGAWMSRRPDLATAGRNLEAVAALLMPVVGYAVGRPGLLALAPRASWQLASAISLGAYLLASGRTRRPFYSGAAALAAASLLLASLGALAAGWQLVPVVALMAALLLVVDRLRSTGDPQLAEGPRWVALIGAPVTLLAAALLYLADPSGGYAFAASLGVGALFCVLAHWLEGKPFWLWAAVALPPAAAQVACLVAGSSLAIQALSLSGLGLVYFGLGAALEGRHRPALAPLFTGALGLGLLTLPLAGADLAAARLALPPLILMSVGAVALVERGRLAWLGERRLGTASGSLAAAAALLAGWLGALLFNWTGSVSAGALWLLPLAGVYFAGAFRWPGRRRASYDQILQIAGIAVAFIAGAAAIVDAETRLAAALLLGVIFGGQALARRIWPWAAVSLAAGALAAVFAVQRFVPPDAQLRTFTFVALGLAIGYSLGGERLRRTALRYWTLPAVAIGALSGLIAAAMALAQVELDPRLFTGVLLALAALLGVHTALWRRGELGYPAAALIVAGTMVAASQGFFIGWPPAAGDLGYVICGLALGLALLGQLLRRSGRLYALPYELAAFAVLPIAPLLAGADPAHLTMVWAALAGLYGAALWRYRLPWMLGLAFVALDLALLHGAAWRLPGGDPAGAGLILTSAVVAQALFSAWARRRPAPLGGAALWAYLSAGIGGVGALALAMGSPGHVAAVAGALAALAALLVWIEGREALAWAALGLLGLALGQLDSSLGLTPTWGLLVGCLEALAIYVGGWGVQGLSGRLPRLAPWRRPLAYGGGVAILLLPLSLGLWGALAGDRGSGAALLLLGLGVGLVGWREKLPALAGVALGAWALALEFEGSTRSPETWAAVGPYIFLGLAWVMGVAALTRRLVEAARGAGLVARAGLLHRSIYSATAMAGLLALWEASEKGPLAVVFLGLAALAALVATAERAEPAAWVSLGLAVVGAWFGHDALGIAPPWAAAWIVLELAGVCLVGWAAALAGLGMWRRPTTLGAAGAGVLHAALVALLALGGGDLAPLTFALASLGLLLVTVAVRERELYYAYVAGAAFVGAALCQLADWGMREPQWYVIPAGLYLLALAAGLRHFQGQRRASQLVETAAVALLLAVTFAQAIRDDGGPAYSLLLFGEALAVAAYGAIARLRVPFLGGVCFFVAGVTWMTVDTVRLANQWVLLGGAGLLMVLAYVVLERHQERLVRAGRQWVAQLQGWG